MMTDAFARYAVPEDRNRMRFQSIELSEGQIASCRRRGQRLAQWAVEHNYSSQWPHTGDEEVAHILGVSGHLAFCLMHGLPYEPDTIGVFRAWDVRIGRLFCDVKTRPYIVGKSDLFVRAFSLCGEKPDLFAQMIQCGNRFVYVGWAWASEVMIEKYIRKYAGNSYVFPFALLHSGLPETEAEDVRLQA